MPVCLKRRCIFSSFSFFNFLLSVHFCLLFFSTLFLSVEKICSSFYISFLSTIWTAFFYLSFHWALARIKTKRPKCDPSLSHYAYWFFNGQCQHFREYNSFIKLFNLKTYNSQSFSQIIKAGVDTLSYTNFYIASD